MTERHIVAMGGGGFSMEDPLLDRYVLDLVDSPRPKICLLPTASQALPLYVTRFLNAFPASRFEPTYLDLFARTVADVDAFLGEQDVIYVGGGNTANMLAIWRIHGVDAALRRAWEAGVVCCGISAGGNCWFEASTTDSYLIGRADPLRDGLAFLPGSFCPHYDGEESRRPEYRRQVASGELPPGYAADDYAAVHFTGETFTEAIASKQGATVYRVTTDDDGGSIEEPVTTRLLR
ncbi:MAG TPA: peptidase E [Actinomycetota bacterium]